MGRVAAPTIYSTSTDRQELWVKDNDDGVDRVLNLDDVKAIDGHRVSYSQLLVNGIVHTVEFINLNTNQSFTLRSIDHLIYNIVKPKFSLIPKLLVLAILIIGLYQFSSAASNDLRNKIGILEDSTSVLVNTEIEREFSFAAENCGVSVASLNNYKNITKCSAKLRRKNEDITDTNIADNALKIYSNHSHTFPSYHYSQEYLEHFNQVEKLHQELLVSKYTENYLPIGFGLIGFIALSFLNSKRNRSAKALTANVSKQFKNFVELNKN